MKNIDAPSEILPKQRAVEAFREGMERYKSPSTMSSYIDDWFRNKEKTCEKGTLNALAHVVIETDDSLWMIALKNALRVAGTSAELDSNVADKLIDEGFESDVAFHLRAFRNLGPETVMKLTEKGGMLSILHHEKSFREIPRQFFEQVIREDHGISLMTAVWRGDFSWKFMDQIEFLNAFLNHGKEQYGHQVVVSMRAFDESRHDEVARILIRTGYAEDVKRYIESFKNLTDETRQMLLT